MGIHRINAPAQTSRRSVGFTLVEVIIVVLILAILATITGPKVLNRVTAAEDASARESLKLIRDAIELYFCEWGKYPRGNSTPIQDEIGLYLQGGSFPACSVGNKNNQVRVVATGPFDVSGTEGWAYNPRKGDFIINSNSASATDPSTTYSEW